MVILNATARCDRCGARAAVQACKQGFSELLFCGHHQREHEDALLLDGWALVFDDSPEVPQPVAAYTES